MNLWSIVGFSSIGFIMIQYSLKKMELFLLHLFVIWNILNFTRQHEFFIKGRRWFLLITETVVPRFFPGGAPYGESLLWIVAEESHNFKIISLFIHRIPGSLSYSSLFLFDRTLLVWGWQNTQLSRFLLLLVEILQPAGWFGLVVYSIRQFFIIQLNWILDIQNAIFNRECISIRATTLTRLINGKVSVLSIRVEFLNWFLLRFCRII